MDRLALKTFLVALLGPAVCLGKAVSATPFSPTVSFTTVGASARSGCVCVNRNMPRSENTTRLSAREAKAIRAPVNKDIEYIKAHRAGGTEPLRPHYQHLLRAYEDEFTHQKGLTDPLVIEFFDNFVHDSLAGFAKDETLPSDPRCCYIGGDKELKFADNSLVKDRSLA